MAAPGPVAPFWFRRLRRVRPGVQQRPLVLIHGMSSGPGAWDPVLPLLAETRVVHVVTLPGHRGGAPIEDPARFTSTDYVDAVEAELDERGIDQADLVGNSLGGWVALQLAGRGRAASVVCLAPAGGWVTGGSFDRFLGTQFAVAFRTCRRMLTPRGQRLLQHPAMRRVLLFGMVARPERVGHQQYREIVKDIAGCKALEVSILRPSARDLSEVPRLEVPVLIAWSDRDRILVSSTSRRRLEQQVGDPEVILLPDVGHVPMSDAPETIAALVLEFSGRSVAAEPA